MKTKKVVKFNQIAGELNWKQSARNSGQHKLWFDNINGWFVHCIVCGYKWNACHQIHCTNCGADGISEAARVFFAGKGKGKEKMQNIFARAVDRLSQDRPKQFVFTVEVVIRDTDLEDRVFEDAVEMIRSYAAFEVVDVEELDSGDDRRL